MKYIAIFALALVLSGCDNSLSSEQKNIKTQFQQIEEMTKENLPLAIGEFIALTKVEQVEDGLSLKFTYQVAEYDTENTSIINEQLEQSLVYQNCNNDTFAPLFKDGANVIISYETIESKPIFELRFNDKTCQ